MSYNELYHYGVPGMKWGVRRYRDSAGARRYGENASSSGNSGRKRIDKRKLARNIALGLGAAAAVGGAAYGIHRLRKSGKLDDYIAKGREAIGNARSSAGPTLERYANKGREVVGNARSKVNAGIDKVASLPVERYADRAYEKTRQQLRSRKKRR